MIILFLFGFLGTSHVPLLQKAVIPLMIEDNVTQNVAPAGSRHRTEPLLSVSYTANSGLKIGVLTVKTFPNYAYYPVSSTLWLGSIEFNSAPVSQISVNSFARE